MSFQTIGPTCKYVTYLHKANDIVFIIWSRVRLAKFWATGTVDASGTVFANGIFIWLQPVLQILDEYK